jgi:hypothetical protein
LADLDGDGHVDLLSGSWPGEIHFFKGGPGRTFAAPVKLKHKTGKSINVGGGPRKSGTDMILVAGDATFEDTEKGRFIVYDGERIEIPEGCEGGITGTASAVHAVDWDGDKDLDLLVGEIRGGVHLVSNEGTPTAPAFGKATQLRFGLMLPVQVSGDAGPFTADWDGDGDLDLLVGSGDGSVVLFRNAGALPPRLGPPEQLVPPSSSGYGDKAPTEPMPGHRTKVCAADWNGDGRLDLLVGDFATQKAVRPEPTPEERAEHERIQKECDETMGRYRELWAKVSGPTRVKDEAEGKKAAEELSAVQRKLQELSAKLPRKTESHGWVWLYLRRSPTAG